MNTPICDFVNAYKDSNTLRLHMPGHKGSGPIGVESIDLTEISGADSLYEASGIIRESEENAGSLFGAHTFFSTEGSSLAIRAMLYLAVLFGKRTGTRPLIAAARNVHKTFLSAAALLDFDVMWLYPEETASYLSCIISAEHLDNILQNTEVVPTAVYITSPDYLGNTSDIAALSAVCKKHGILLLVDNAHGAYLKFLPESRHPIDLGADMCCDSAHKTLPVLTGGAYLHISPSLPVAFAEHAKNALSMFGSTSPSYLILQSLDAANKYIADGYREKLSSFSTEIENLRSDLINHGFSLCGDEPLKISVSTKSFGYTGTEIADILEQKLIICEFADPDFIVFMLTPQTGSVGINALKTELLSIAAKPPIAESSPVFSPPQQVVSIRSASFSRRENLPIDECDGRILASSTVGCPPAVPIVMCGERISPENIRCFEYYGITECVVIAD